MDHPTFSAPAGGNPTPPPLPPFSPPPLMSPPPPVPKPRKSRGWMITAIVLIVVLAFSLLGNVAQMAVNSLWSNHSFKNSTAREVGPRLEECVLEDNDAHNKIAVISVDGIITSHGDDGAGYNLVEVIKAQLLRAADDDAVKAVILKIDSPGGEVMASDQIYKALNDFQADEAGENGKPGREGKPIICSMGSLAASGGYYIAAPCRWIVADELTLTGSIGVIMHGYNFRGLMDKIGVAPMTYKSGKFKDMLSPDRSTNDIPVEERAMVQALIDETFQKFKGIVREGREAAHEANKKEGRALAKDWEDYADGRVVSGTQAFQLGFVDELGDFDYAVERAMEIAHLKKANLVEYQQRYDIANFLSMFGQSGQVKDLKIDLGVNLPKLRAGYLYFLAPNFVN